MCEEPEELLYVLRTPTHINIPMDIIKNPKICNYTLGIYARLIYLYTKHLSWDIIYNFGQKQNINKALNTLEQNNYIHVDFEKGLLKIL